MKGYIYFLSIVILTGLILTGLFYYEKSLTINLKDVGSLNIGKGVRVNFDKVYSQPAETTGYNLIFYLNAKNSSSEYVKLYPDEPQDPCSKYESNYYTPYPTRYYGVTPTPVASTTPTMTIQQCEQTNEYKAYQAANKVYEDWMSNPNKIEVFDSNIQSCTANDSYRIDKRPNLGYQLFSDYQANQTKTGALVYTCLKNKGKFTIKYLEQSLNFEM